MQEEIVQLLSHKLINVNSGDTNQRTAIAVAAGEGNVEVVRFLVSTGAEVNKVDAEGNTPLFYALQGAIRFAFIGLFLLLFHHVLLLFDSFVCFSFG
jgi:hypothetical protein